MKEKYHEGNFQSFSSFTVPSVKLTNSRGITNEQQDRSSSRLLGVRYGYIRFRRNQDAHTRPTGR